MINDLLLDSIVAGAEIQSGAESRWVSRRLQLHPAIAQPGKTKRQTASVWREDEDEFVCRHACVLPAHEIAARLGRSVEAVKIRSSRRMLTTSRRRPGYITGNRAAFVLGIDIHTIVKLYRLGRLPMQELPLIQKILHISVLRLYMWATHWKNWIYFKPQNMRDLHLRRLVELAQSRWNDEWLTTGQAAKFFGVSSSAINKRILSGDLPGVRWGNWYVLRSDIERLVIYPGKGGNAKIPYTTARQDEFMLRAAREGKTYDEIARMMKWRNGKAVNHRMSTMGYKRHPQWIRKEKS